MEIEIKREKIRNREGLVRRANMQMKEKVRDNNYTTNKFLYTENRLNLQTARTVSSRWES